MQHVVQWTATTSQPAPDTARPHPSPASYSVAGKSGQWEIAYRALSRFDTKCPGAPVGYGSLCSRSLARCTVRGAAECKCTAACGRQLASDKLGSGILFTSKLPLPFGIPLVEGRGTFYLPGSYYLLRFTASAVFVSFALVARSSTDCVASRISSVRLVICRCINRSRERMTPWRTKRKASRATLEQQREVL